MRAFFVFIDLRESVLSPPFQGGVRIRVPVHLAEYPFRFGPILRPRGNESLDQKWVEFIQLVVVGPCNRNALVGVLAPLLHLPPFHRHYTNPPPSILLFPLL